MKQYAKFVSDGSMSMADPPSFQGMFSGPSEKWESNLGSYLKMGWTVINTAVSAQPPDRYGCGVQVIIFLLEREAPNADNPPFREPGL